MIEELEKLLKEKNEKEIRYIMDDKDTDKRTLFKNYRESIKELERRGYSFG